MVRISKSIFEGFPFNKDCVLHLRLLYAVRYTINDLKVYFSYHYVSFLYIIVHIESTPGGLTPHPRYFTHLMLTPPLGVIRPPGLRCSSCSGSLNDRQANKVLVIDQLAYFNVLPLIPY